MILPEEDGSCFRIAVVGAGPVGLSFAIATSDLLRRSEPSLPFFIDVFERRIVRANPTAPFVWQDVNRPDRPETERNARRQQVVTIQSTVFAALPPVIQESIEPRAEKVWPLTDDSPKELGHPLNVRIRDIEDVLLAVAQDTPNVRVHLSAGPSAFSDESAAAIRAVAGRVHMLVGADGRGSHVFETFKKPTHGVLGFRRENLDVAGDEVLGVLVRQPPAESEQAALDRQRLAVITTLVQSRYLLNARETKEGRVGFLNMRLATSEARYAHGGGGPDGTGQACNQAVPCRLWSMHNPAGDNTGVNCVASCSHGGVFYPSAKDAPPEAAAVLERLLDGAALYGIPRSALTDIVRFRLDVTEQTRFILAAPPSPLNSPSAVMPKFGTWKRPLVSLVGDAAIPVHFWPGRGLNTGLRCAIALAIKTVEAAVLAHREDKYERIEYSLVVNWSDYMNDMSQREQCERSVGALRHEPRGPRSAHADTLRSIERSVKDVLNEVIDYDPAALLAEAAVDAAERLGRRYLFKAGGEPDDVRRVLLDCISNLKNEKTLDILWKGGRAHPPAIAIDADRELSVYEALQKFGLVKNDTNGGQPTLDSDVLVNDFCEFIRPSRYSQTPKWIFKYRGAGAAAAEAAAMEADASGGVTDVAGSSADAVPTGAEKDEASCCQDSTEAEGMEADASGGITDAAGSSADAVLTGEASRCQGSTEAEGTEARASGRADFVRYYLTDLAFRAIVRLHTFR